LRTSVVARVFKLTLGKAGAMSAKVTGRNWQSVGCESSLWAVRCQMLVSSACGGCAADPVTRC